MREGRGWPSVKTEGEEGGVAVAVGEVRFAMVDVG
jgi:hypothetical protein